jgi:hypothetical protein
MQEIWVIENWNLGFICNLSFVIWNLQIVVLLDWNLSLRIRRGIYEEVY